MAFYLYNTNENNIYLPRDGIDIEFLAPLNDLD